MKSIEWGTRILTISLLIALVLVSGCILDFGKNKLDFGNSADAQKALACFCQTYGDPAAYSGPPRLIAPLVSTELKDNIPQDKVTRFSTDTHSIFFWVIYQNFQQGDDLHLSWIFQNKVVTTMTKKTDSKTGIAFGEFIRPDAGWPVGTHAIKIEGGGNSTQVAFDIANGPTERIIFDFTRPAGVSCSDLISYINIPPAEGSTIPSHTDVNWWISARTSNSVLSCNTPNNTMQFMGNTGPAVTPETKVNLKLFNVPNSGIQDIPLEGILIGSTNTKNDGGWEYTWNGAPYYLLRNNQEYMVKAMLPDGTYTKLSFLYQCPVPTQYLWVSGGLSNTELSCDPPNNTLQFSGNTYVAPAGTLVQLKLFDLPDSGTHDLPLDGILIGSTNTRNDGSYEYRWNGNVPGYRLKNGQEYFMKAVFPDSGLSTGGSFRYMCTGTNVDYSVSGRTSSPSLSCYPPVYTLQFLGSTGPAVTPGTQIQLKLFNMPDASNQEILIGSTNTRNDRSWEYTWNGNVPGYMLKNGQEYGVKAMLPDGTYTKMSFLYLCSDPEGKWQIYGGPANSVLSCSPPNNTIKFTGYTGPSVMRGIDIQLKLFHMPDAGDQEILIGSTNSRNDGTWEYTWNGKVAGYTFKDGQGYGIKAVLPWRYTKMGFTYKCPT